MLMISEVEHILALKRLFWVLMVLAFAVLPVRPQVDRKQSALSLETQGKLTEAESAWGAISKANPSNPEPFAHLGLLQARQEHYLEAITYYRRAMRLNPSMPGLSLNLGLALFKAGEYKQAILTFEPLLKTRGEDQRLTILIGMAHYGLGEYAAAVPYLRRAIKHDPQNLELLLDLGHSCLLSRQFQCVVDVYHQIISLNAESAEADMLGGEALDEMKDKNGAIEEFRAAVKANPKEPNVHFGLGYLLWTQFKFEEAAREFKAELDNDPAHVQAMLYLAEADIKLNRMKDARHLLEQVVKIDPAISKAHLDLGIVLSEAGLPKDALKELQVATKLAPGDVDAHWRIGQLYRSMGEMNESKAEFKKAQSLIKTTNDRLLDVMPRRPDKSIVPEVPLRNLNDKQP
jgi:tetratricopeptide (TPR) repeat protein